MRRRGLLAVPRGDSGGYAEWLADVLARPERVVPVLRWDWYEMPSFIQTLPSSAESLDLPFPPGFHENIHADWQSRAQPPTHASLYARSTINKLIQGHQVQARRL